MAEQVAAVVLAAGAGRRMGGPKALLRNDSGRTWVATAVDVVRQGGCDPVIVVLGAAAEQARAALTDDDGHRDLQVVIAPDWHQGMGASLRAGLTALTALAAGNDDGPRAALVMLVDTPGVGPDIVERVRAVAASDTLARASYDGRPGHPVVLGRSHWTGVIASAIGDHGARDYLAGRPVDLVECADLGDGRDIDTPSERQPT